MMMKQEGQIKAPTVYNIIFLKKKQVYKAYNQCTGQAKGSGNKKGNKENEED